MIENRQQMVDTLWRGNRRLMHDLKLFVGMVVILSPYEPPLATSRSWPTASRHEPPLPATGYTLASRDSIGVRVQHGPTPPPL